MSAKSSLRRRSEEMNKVLNQIIEKIKRNGYTGTIFLTEIERLLISRSSFQTACREVVEGFKDVEHPRGEIINIMKGRA